MIFILPQEAIAGKVGMVGKSQIKSVANQANDAKEAMIREAQKQRKTSRIIEGCSIPYLASKLKDFFWRTQELS